ncbi:MAG: methyltransferase domain-containing protein [Porticoccus sp.]|jgi:tRNA (cmo5U34)-methyltransferase|uniref:methyltransferase domain-containing protein n=1 Tax=Porticoccus sp. Uisw_050_02 TaxID=3230978 RepID=UPI001D7E0265|nr:methyltransferase domain-containing protein [Porticoccus sp.]|tara:strand:+ start:8989 stop:9708 length:720 start_codon:yes stop_codon:yes gene_type:complete
MTKVGDGLPADRANWKFNGEVVDLFDDHISRSVPLYEEGHDLICDMSDFFIKPDSLCYEVGCSTGTLTLKLAIHNQKKPEARFIGIDIEKDMIKKASGKATKIKGLNVSFIADDVIELEMDNADLIVCYYTIQFINTSVRQKLIDKLYSKLNWGGALLLFEKVHGADARFQDILSALYSDYKIRQGYSADEIIAKSRSLKGVLEPFSTQGNLDMLKRAGFVDINTVQKYLCFEGFLAIK